MGAEPSGNKFGHKENSDGFCLSEDVFDVVIDPAQAMHLPLYNNIKYRFTSLHRTILPPASRKHILVQQFLLPKICRCRSIKTQPNIAGSIHGFRSSAKIILENCLKLIDWLERPPLLFNDLMSWSRSACFVHFWLSDLYSSQKFKPLQLELRVIENELYFLSSLGALCTWVCNQSCLLLYLNLSVEKKANLSFGIISSLQLQTQ